MRAFRRSRIVILLASAFLVGGASTEIVLRARAAVEQVSRERRVGAAGQLVMLEIVSPEGEVLARPRIIAPVGKTAELVLHDPARPGDVRLAARIAAVHEASGFIHLDYALWVPDRAISARGRLSLTPGVEQAVSIAGGAIVASIVALPVPSAAFDAFLEAESARRAFVKTS
jgi:hypothetical protein